MNVIAQLCQERDRARQAVAEATRRLQETVQKEVSVIAEQTANAARLDQMIATLQNVSYPVQSQQLVDQPLQDVGARPAPVRKPAPQKAGSMPRGLGLVARVIVDAVEKAGPEGLSGTEVNQAVIEAGYTRDASEKNKTRLKNKNLIRHDFWGQRWYSINQPEAEP